VAYVLALLSAACYGAADFLGGLAARGAATVAVVLVTQASGLLVLALLLPVLPDAAPAPRDLWLGAVAGVTGSIGVALLYRALAIGTMAIVAPTTAVCAVVIPVVAGLLMGERPAVHALVGIALALVAIVLVSQQPAASATSGPVARVPRGLGLAVASGVAIGFFFLSLAQTTMEAGLWPLAVARSASLVLFGLVAVRRVRLRMPWPVFGIAVAGGILDMLANALYLIAVREGPLTVVVTLSSLYPASTVLLARLVLHERLHAVQSVGIAAALVAVVLVVS
jgi:drug/metabolite transporter (DMT)-like permease